MARINDITDAIASYINANLATLPVSIEGAYSQPVTYHAADMDRSPRVFINPMSTAQVIDTRDSYRYHYIVSITVTSLLSAADDESRIQLQSLVERIRFMIRDVAMSGADHVMSGSESAVDEFDIEQESLGQYFVSALQAEYREFD